MQRRTFIRATVAAVGTAVTPSLAARLAAGRNTLVETRAVQALPDNVERIWLGESFWANRLQDWRLAGGRIECLCGDAGFEVRTVALLTRFLNDRHAAGRISARVGLVDPAEAGFCGFLLGIGAGELDYRGCALVHARSGENGGFMAVIDDTGQPAFRDFSSETDSLAFERLERSGNLAPGPLGTREVVLDCHIDPVADGGFDVRLMASDARTGEELGFAVRTAVPAGELKGGIALLSSPPSGKPGARWWFTDVATGGDKIDVHPERALGPVMGCLHSLNRRVLKMTAQFLPISVAEQADARLDYRRAGETEWTKGPVVEIGDGYVAAFRLDGWDYRKTHDYRIVDPNRDGTALFEGRILEDPGTGRELRIALYSCLIPSSKRVDEDAYTPAFEGERVPRRFTPDNILFPHQELVGNCDSHDPDLYVFCGDQYYEGYPTRFGRHTPEAELDTLYRWYLWYWTFRDSVRDKPAILLADDHDILQGNVWGNAGIGSEKEREEDGGYKWDKDVVRMVYRIQHGHNPDPYDPTPIRFDIPVAYGEFIYGGTSFCLVEDRKFKSPPDTGIDPKDTRGELLGARQEAFLKRWAETNTDLPKVCLTASIWGSPQTIGNTEPLIDYDANGYPPDGRTRAVQLAGKAKALVLAGDQHLAMIARQGVNDYEDGPLFFAGPAAASFWQRWFEGEGKLENQRNGDPNTGNFIDCFGNKMRVLAVANPNMPYLEFKQRNKTWGNFVAERAIKSEGYGIIRIRHQTRTAVLECWPWNEDPKTGNQFPGWPYEHSLENTT